MAKKKSERGEHPDFSTAIFKKSPSAVFVYDGDYLMGVLRMPLNCSMVEVYSPAAWAESRGEFFLETVAVSRRAAVSSEAKRRQLRMEHFYPKWWTYGNPRAILVDDFAPSEVKAVAARAVRESRMYVTAPHPNRRGQRISISEEKLAPIVRKLIDGGIRKIDYEFLLRALKM